ncbi:type IX secretion system protein PorQ [Rhodocaloribacter litoris]|nr:type IX secretion system protein PorQ [Rhodocaloribacter litoris]
MRSFRFPMRLRCLLLFLVVPLAATAQPGDVTGFSFLRLEPSARAAALGGSYAAVYGDDANALFYNPALLNEQMHGMLSLSYLNHLADLNAGFAAYSRHYEGLGTFGLGLRFLSWGRLDRADEHGERQGTFGASDVALTLGAARTYGERLRYGAGIHAVYSSIAAYNASALAVDLGVLYLLAEQNLTLSASVNNLGVTLSSLGTLTRDELPLDLRLGFTKRLRHLPLLITVMGYNLHDLGDGPENASAVSNVLRYLAFGGEFQFSEAFNLRFGYNHRRHEDLKLKSRLDLAGFGIGVGLKITRVRVDYAFNSWSSLGGLHQFTVRTRL